MLHMENTAPTQDDITDSDGKEMDEDNTVDAFSEDSEEENAVPAHDMAPESSSSKSVCAEEPDAEPLPSPELERPETKTLHKTKEKLFRPFEGCENVTTDVDEIGKPDVPKLFIDSNVSRSGFITYSLDKSPFDYNAENSSNQMLLTESRDQKFGLRNGNYDKGKRSPRKKDNRGDSDALCHVACKCCARLCRREFPGKETMKLKTMLPKIYARDAHSFHAQGPFFLNEQIPKRRCADGSRDDSSSHTVEERVLERGISTGTNSCRDKLCKQENDQTDPSSKIPQLRLKQNSSIKDVFSYQSDVHRDSSEEYNPTFPSHQIVLKDGMSGLLPNALSTNRNPYHVKTEESIDTTNSGFFTKSDSDPEFDKDIHLNNVNNQHSNCKQSGTPFTQTINQIDHHQKKPFAGRCPENHTQQHQNFGNNETSREAHESVLDNDAQNTRPQPHSQWSYDGRTSSFSDDSFNDTKNNSNNNDDNNNDNDENGNLNCGSDGDLDDDETSGYDFDPVSRPSPSAPNKILG
ncbi:putative uncharacterized protein DDB_G0279653 [Aplysia californica]|uniref:Uncharacterized protein n=1 Tax=Aplysia californica TaxID=6500 RepID=A0ABM1W398_APLCA|nr:putative uncharacterized protein DDB_G0279653 [Aplysia californica]